MKVKGIRTSAHGASKVTGSKGAPSAKLARCSTIPQIGEIKVARVTMARRGVGTRGCKHIASIYGTSPCGPVLQKCGSPPSPPGGLQMRGGQGGDISSLLYATPPMNVGRRPLGEGGGGGALEGGVRGGGDGGGGG